VSRSERNDLHSYVFTRIQSSSLTIILNRLASKRFFQ
jgi:hypothetical protein